MNTTMHSCTAVEGLGTAGMNEREDEDAGARGQG